MPRINGIQWVEFFSKGAIFEFSGIFLEFQLKQNSQLDKTVFSSNLDYLSALVSHLPDTAPSERISLYCATLNSHHFLAQNYNWQHKRSWITFFGGGRMCNAPQSLSG